MAIQGRWDLGRERRRRVYEHLLNSGGLLLFPGLDSSSWDQIVVPGDVGAVAPLPIEPPNLQNGAVSVSQGP